MRSGDPTLDQRVAQTRAEVAEEVAAERAEEAEGEHAPAKAAGKMAPPAR